jgi:hypothetical protein
MANFIIGILEKNKEHVHDFKEVVFNRNSFFAGKWAYDNLGIFVIFCNAIVYFAVIIFVLLATPIAATMVVINAVYNLCKLIVGTTFFYKRLIKKSLIEYEDSLKKRKTYYLSDTRNGCEWKCIVLDPNIEDFISKFFKNFNLIYDTYETDTNRIICRRHRRRSIGDLYLICKSYYPDTRLDDVIKCLIKLIKSETIAVSKCSDIKKYVFVLKDSYTNNHMDKDVEFIHGVSFKQLITYYGRT